MNFPEVFDSTMVACLKTCPQKFYKEYILEYKPKDLSVHLHAGAAYAKGLEVAREAFFVERQDADTAIATGIAALLEYYGTFECPVDSAKSAVNMAGALQYYFTRYPLRHDLNPPITLPGGRRGIEFSFAHPLGIYHPTTGNPIIYAGRMDAILEFAGNQFIFDEKTTGALGASWAKKWDLRSQFTGYAWGCREADIKVAGVVVRGVAILKTKYEAAQAICYRADWEIHRWYLDLIDLITDAIRWYENHAWRYNLDDACTSYGQCPFFDACKSKDEQAVIDTKFTRRHWDPVLRRETPLEVAA